VWDTQAVPLGQRYEQDAKGKPSLQELRSLVSVPTTLATLVANLEAVAPEPIEGDLQQLQQGLQGEGSSVGDASKDPVGALANGVTSGIEIATAYHRVDAYLSQNCGTGS
jgi:hypothetical protein